MGLLMKTAQKLSMTLTGRQAEYFFKRHYTLNLATKTLQIKRLGKDKVDLTVQLDKEGYRVI